MGSLDHFSRDVLVCSKRGVNLSLNNSEIFLETTTPKYVNLSGATANGWGEKELFFATGFIGNNSLLERLSLYPEIRLKHSSAVIT